MADFKSESPADFISEWPADMPRNPQPRDIYVLRRLGKAYLDQQRLEDAGIVVSLIGELDAKAFVRNAENAALKARWHRERGDLAAAAVVLRAAAEASPRSYYLGDLLGQALLEAGEIDEAKAAYQRVIEVISGLRERNVWVVATGLTAAIAVGDGVLLEELLKSLPAERVTSEQAETIRRGVGAVARRCGADLAVLGRLEAALG